MKCEYCDHDIAENDKFCANCGASVIEESAHSSSQGENEVKEPNNKTEKKKTSPAKIIAIVFIASALVVGLSFGAIALLMSQVLPKNANGTYDFSDIYGYFEDELDDEYEIDKWFSQDFDDDYSDSNVYDKSDSFGTYKSAENFKSGVISEDKNTYKSDFNGLSFQLPTAWEIYDSDDLNKIYNKEGISKSIVNNNLLRYDLYADNDFNNANLYICYYNAEYFSEYKSLLEFDKLIKDQTNEYASYDYTVDYADDSTITINGEKYDMLAARISSKGGSVYQYDFTRLVNGYYMQISIFARSTDDVGEVIDILNSKG